MPNTTKVSLLAAVLPIPGDPFQRSMGILISIDGKRCVSEFIRDRVQATELLSSPVYREQFKKHGFDLFTEAVRFVDNPTHDPEYIRASAFFRREWEMAKTKVDTIQKEKDNAHKN